MPSLRNLALLKATVFVACSLPGLWLGHRFMQDTLGANPIEALTRGSGQWALYLLLATLAVTPLRRLSGFALLMRVRRMLGLFAFGYALAHFVLYLWLDQFFDWAAIADDLLGRPFIAVGFAAFVLMLPLALTSTHAMMRRLGGRRWQHLHRSIYPLSILAVLHYGWLVKADLLGPLAVALGLAVLLGLRGFWRWQERGRPLAAPLPHPPAGRRIIPIRPRHEGGPPAQKP